MDSKLKIAVELLKEILHYGYPTTVTMRSKIREALAAIGPIEPDAGQDERAAFEAWSDVGDYRKNGVQHDVAGWYYFDDEYNDMWKAWQARAALTAKPAKGVEPCAPGPAEKAGGLPEATDAMVEAWITFADRASTMNHPEVPFNGTVNGDSAQAWHRRYVRAALNAALAARPTAMGAGSLDAAAPEPHPAPESVDTPDGLSELLYAYHLACTKSPFFFNGQGAMNAYLKIEDWHNTKLAEARDGTEKWVAAYQFQVQEVIKAQQKAVLQEQRAEKAEAEITQHLKDKFEMSKELNEMAKAGLPELVAAGALRQFQHNNGSGLVFGYDMATINREFAKLKEPK